MAMQRIRGHIPKGVSSPSVEIRQFRNQVGDTDERPSFVMHTGLGEEPLDGFGRVSCIRPISPEAGDLPLFPQGNVQVGHLPFAWPLQPLQQARRGALFIATRLSAHLDAANDAQRTRRLQHPLDADQGGNTQHLSTTGG